MVRSLCVLRTLIPFAKRFRARELTCPPRLARTQTRRASPRPPSLSLVNIPVLLGLLFLKQLILPLLSHASPSGRGATARPGLLAWALGNTFFWEAVGVAVVVLVNGKWQGLIAERAFGGGRAAGTGGKGLGGGSAGSSL